MTLAGNAPRGRGPDVARMAERLPDIVDPPTAAEVAWAAGLIEGEGCVYGATRATGTSISVIVQMTDLDVVLRLHRLFNVGKVYGPRWNGHPHTQKPFWRWEVGKRAHVDEIVTLIYPWLGARRQYQVRTAYLRAGRALPFEDGR